MDGQALIHLLSSFFISFFEGEMGMKTIQSELAKKGFADVLKQEVEKENSKTSKLQKERLSDQELRELMGTNRDTFKRHRGAIRRR
jgi:predicted transglutaminase-like cysteine proteinase